jgi:hypothetical protein
LTGSRRSTWTSRATASCSSASRGTASVFTFSARPAPFDTEPAVARAAGWWQIANPGKQLWDPDVPVTAEAFADWAWQPVAVDEVEPLAGLVQVAGRHQKLRLAGSFHPLTAVAQAARWRLETSLVAPGPSLGGSSATSRAVGAVAVLEAATVTGEISGGCFYVVLGTGDGAYRGRGTAISGTDVLRVTVDPSSCRHIDDRARP